MSVGPPSRPLSPPAAPLTSPMRVLVRRNLWSLAVLGTCLVFAQLGWSLFIDRLQLRAARSQGTALEVARIWGGPLQQPQPEVRWRRVDAATVELTPVDLARSRVKVDLTASYRRRGMTEVPGYEVDFQGEYDLQNPSDHGAFVAFRVGLPVGPEALMLRDLKLLINGKEEPAMTEYTPAGVTWTGAVAPATPTRFSLSYRARGLERFGYALGPTSEKRARPVTDFQLALTVRGARGTLDFPVGSMAPTREVPVDGGQQLVWEVDRLLTEFDLGVVLPDARGMEDSLRKLVGSAGWFLALYGIGLMFALAAASPRVRALHALGLCGAFFLFFPLVTYLAAYLPWPLALALSLAAITAAAVMHALRFLSRRAAWLLGLNHLFFIAAPAVAYLVPGPGGAAGAHTGLILVLAALGALVVAMRLLGRMAESLQECEANPPVVLSAMLVTPEAKP